jgi:hypothetical protein
MTQSLKTDVNVPAVQESISKKNLEKKFFVGIFKVTDEYTVAGYRAGSGDPDPFSSVQIQGSGSVPKCHGSGTLVVVTSRDLCGFPLILLGPLFLVAVASPCFIELRFDFLSCFCLVSYVTISGSYLKHIGR